MINVVVKSAAGNKYHAIVAGNLGAAGDGDTYEDAIGRLVYYHCSDAMRKINLEKHGSHWHASIPERPEASGSGKTAVTALGHLISFHGRAVEIDVRDESSN